MKIIKLDYNNATQYLDHCWKYIQAFTQLNDRRKQYILLCGFANHFFPVTGETQGVDVREEREFWDMLQSGLTSKDSVNRLALL